MCGDGRLVDMKAYVNGRLGGIEAGACGACGAFNYNRYPHLSDVRPTATDRRRTDFSYYKTYRGCSLLAASLRGPALRLGPNNLHTHSPTGTTAGGAHNRTFFRCAFLLRVPLYIYITWVFS